MNPNKSINIKLLAATVVSILIAVVFIIKLNVKTVETTQHLIETTKEIVKKDLSSVTEKTKVHDNSNENTKLHIVYEIYSIDSWGIKMNTIKFGISSRNNYVKKAGNPRPNLQLKKIQKHTLIKGYTVKYDIVYNKVEGRIKAKLLEKQLVTNYFNTYGEMPVLQKLPLPEDLF